MFLLIKKRWEETQKMLYKMIEELEATRKLEAARQRRKTT